jgi:hypothetical protein
MDSLEGFTEDGSALKLICVTVGKTQFHASCWPMGVFSSWLLVGGLSKFLDMGSLCGEVPTWQLASIRMRKQAGKRQTAR